MWIIEDAKSYKQIYKPYDYGFLILMYWIPYVPYYFIKTRGYIGIAYIIGLLILLNSGLLLQWGYYYAG